MAKYFTDEFTIPSLNASYEERDPYEAPFKRLLSPQEFNALPQNIRQAFGNYKLYANAFASRKQATAENESIFQQSRAGTFEPAPSYRIPGATVKAAPAQPKIQVHKDIYGRPLMEMGGEGVHTGFGGKQIAETPEAAKLQTDMGFIIPSLKEYEAQKEFELEKGPIAREEFKKQMVERDAQRERAAKELEIKQAREQRLQEQADTRTKQFYEKFEQAKELLQKKQEFTDTKMGKEYQYKLENALAIAAENENIDARQFDKQIEEADRRLKTTMAEKDKDEILKYKLGIIKLQYETLARQAIELTPINALAGQNKMTEANQKLSEYKLLLADKESGKPITTTEKPIVNYTSLEEFKKAKETNAFPPNSKIYFNGKYVADTGAK